MGSRGGWKVWSRSRYTEKINTIIPSMGTFRTIRYLLFLRLLLLPILSPPVAGPTSEPAAGFIPLTTSSGITISLFLRIFSSCFHREREREMWVSLGWRPMRGRESFMGRSCWRCFPLCFPKFLRSCWLHMWESKYLIGLVIPLRSASTSSLSATCRIHIFSTGFHWNMSWRSVRERNTGESSLRGVGLLSNPYGISNSILDCDKLHLIHPKVRIKPLIKMFSQL